MNDGRRAWTDDEDALLFDESLTVAQIAEATGRSSDSVKSRRKRLLRPEGVAASRDWTEDEDDYLRETTHLTARQVAQRMPGRTRRGVIWRRQHLGVDVADYLARNKNPHRLGGRTLVARTCIVCGDLLDASMFYQAEVARVSGAARRQWDRECGPCQYLSGLAADPARRARLDEIGRRLQEETADQATRAHLEWTGVELAQLSDVSVRPHELALRLGRSRAAVIAARGRAGLSRPRKSKDDLRWVIDIPEGVRVPNDRPTGEEGWDW